MNQPKTYIDNVSKEIVSVIQNPNSMLIDSRGFARNMMVKVESSKEVIFMTLEDFAKDYSVQEETEQESSIVEEVQDSKQESVTESSSTVE